MNISNFSSLSIKYKLLITIFGLVVALQVTSIFFQISAQKGILKAELDKRIEMMHLSLESRGKTLIDNLARSTEESVAAYDLYHINELLNGAVEEESELEFAILVNVQGVVLVHTADPSKLNEVLSQPEDNVAVEIENYTKQMYVKNYKKITELMQPIYIGDERWGVLRLGYSLERLNQKIRVSEAELNGRLNIMMFKIIGLATVIILFGGIVTLIIASRISEPLLILSHNAKVLSEGRFDEVDTTSIDAKDEVGHLSAAFIEMARNVKESHNKLENYNVELEKSVEVRTEELRVALKNASTANKKLKDSQEQLIQSEKMASLGQLVAGVAHEINNPINFIESNFKIVCDSVDTIEQTLDSLLPDDEDGERAKALFQKDFKAIRESARHHDIGAKRVTEIVSSLSLYSRVDDENKHATDLNELIEKTLTILSNKTKSIRIHKDFQTLPTVSCFASKISQVFLNIIDNAVYAAYTKHGNSGGEVILVTRAYDDRIEILVRDNGFGIDEKIKHSMFDPFVTSKPVGEGTGMGLAICLKIMNEHDGDLSADNVPEGGAQFKLTIPTGTNTA